MGKNSKKKYKATKIVRKGAKKELTLDQKQFDMFVINCFVRVFRFHLERNVMIDESSGNLSGKYSDFEQNFWPVCQDCILCVRGSTLSEYRLTKLTQLTQLVLANHG